jgi:energy-converting hydrogenase Eha subunit B
VTDSPALLPRLANAAIAGLRLLGIGLAALVMALVATVTTVIGVAAKVLAEVLAQVAGLVREALPFLLGIVPVLARAGLMLGACASIVLAYPFLWTGYAQDTGSLVVGGLIAAGLVLAPLVWAALSGKWASLLGASTGTWALWLLAHLGAGARTFVVLAPLAVLTVQSIFDGRETEHGYEEDGSTDGNPPH